MSPATPTVLIENFRDFSQSLQANLSIINQLTAAPFLIFQIRYSPFSYLLLQAQQSYSQCRQTNCNKQFKQTNCDVTSVATGE